MHLNRYKCVSDTCNQSKCLKWRHPVGDQCGIWMDLWLHIFMTLFPADRTQVQSADIICDLFVTEKRPTQWKDSLAEGGGTSGKVLLTFTGGLPDFTHWKISFLKQTAPKTWNQVGDYLMLLCLTPVVEYNKYIDFSSALKHKCHFDG